MNVTTNRNRDNSLLLLLIESSISKVVDMRLIGIRVSYRKVIQPSHNDSESGDTAAVIDSDLQEGVSFTTVALSQY